MFKAEQMGVEMKAFFVIVLAIEWTVYRVYPSDIHYIYNINQYTW